MITHRHESQVINSYLHENKLLPYNLQLYWSLPCPKQIIIERFPKPHSPSHNQITNNANYRNLAISLNDLDNNISRRPKSHSDKQNRFQFPTVGDGNYRYFNYTHPVLIELNRKLVRDAPWLKNYWPLNHSAPLESKIYISCLRAAVGVQNKFWEDPFFPDMFSKVITSPILQSIFPYSFVFWFFFGSSVRKGRNN